MGRKTSSEKTTVLHLRVPTAHAEEFVRMAGTTGEKWQDTLREMIRKKVYADDEKKVPAEQLVELIREVLATLATIDKRLADPFEPGVLNTLLFVVRATQARTAATTSRLLDADKNAAAIEEVKAKMREHGYKLKGDPPAGADQQTQS